VHAIEHLQLEMVLKKCVENFEPNPNLARRGAVNETGNQLQPFPDLRLLGGTLGAGQGGAEVLFQGIGRLPQPLPSLKKRSVVKLYSSCFQTVSWPAGR